MDDEREPKPLASPLTGALAAQIAALLKTATPKARVRRRAGKKRKGKRMRKHCCPLKTRIDSVGCTVARRVFCSRCPERLAARASSRKE